MGREAEATVTWRGETGLSRVLLERDEIILRGEIRARVARRGLGGTVVDGDDLRLETPDGPLILSLGADAAARWALALAKTPPTLAARLGIGAAARAFVSGDASDAELAAALTGARTDRAGDAALLIAVIDTGPALAAALALAEAHPSLAVWCVYGKGKAAPVSDAQVRSAFRAAGWIDTKTSAVSATLTATRYNRRTG